jgi:maleylpyruvate isomerase
MTPGSTVPAADLARVGDAQVRFEVAVAGVDDATMRRPSLLPGWTVAHVLAHVSRNADSHVRRADAAIRGEMVDQYVGGFDGREREIRSTAALDAVDLLRTVHDSASRLEETWRTVPDAAWSAMSRDVSGHERALSELPGRRWQELEVHVIDLGLGLTYEAWQDDFVSVWLPRLRTGLAARLPAGARAPSPGALSHRDELAWLYGRLTRGDLPVLAPWS